MAKQGEHGISWTDTTWNPVRGCSRVSEGCRYCYAESVAGRFSGHGLPYEGLAEQTPRGGRWTGEVRLVPEHLRDPLRWRKPQRIFVNSMSDLFHEKLTDEEIDRVFGVMLSAPHHTFQVLTKRPDRMCKYMDARYVPGGMLVAPEFDFDKADPQTWPPKNIWLGVSVEDLATAEERIPLLRKTKAAVRFISYEPALGSLELSSANLLDGLDWVISGGESGPEARPANPDWFRSVRDACVSAGVAYHHKQHGEWADYTQVGANGWARTRPGYGRLSLDGELLFDGREFKTLYPFPLSNPGVGTHPGPCMVRVGKKAAGNLLDGKVWAEFPKGTNG